MVNDPYYARPRDIGDTGGIRPDKCFRQTGFANLIESWGIDFGPVPIPGNY